MVNVHSRDSSLFPLLSSIASVSSVMLRIAGLYRVVDRANDMLELHWLPVNLLTTFFSSKGDVGVSCNAKKETTKTIEFNFSTSKRHQQDPPTELFNKLSLCTDTQETTPGSDIQCCANGFTKDQ